VQPKFLVEAPKLKGEYDAKNDPYLKNFFNKNKAVRNTDTSTIVRKFILFSIGEIGKSVSNKNLE
jgi:hypothetical protein